MTTNENYVPKFANTVLEEDGLYLAREKMNPRNFLAELKRRHVYRVAIAYGVVAWLLIQVATQVFPFFEIPNWVVRTCCARQCPRFSGRSDHCLGF